MEKINVLIIEDTAAESEVLCAALEKDYSIVGVAKTYAEALDMFYKHSVDIVIIDVFLNGNPEGIAFAETINVVPNSLKPFVFLTSSNDRQIFERAKLTKPFSFLMKPFNELEILYAIEMAVEKFYDQTNVFSSGENDTVISNDFLFIKKKDALKKVKLEDIIYIEVEERYCHIITEQEKFLILISLTKLMEQLNAKKFFQTHRNIVIQADKIVEIIPSQNLIILKGNHSVTLSDKYKGFISQFHVIK